MNNNTKFYAQLQAILTRLKLLKFKYRIALSVLIISILWFSSGLFYSNSVIEKDSNTKEIVQVKMVESKAQEEMVYLSLTGTVDMQQSVDIVPKISGEIVDVYVLSGSKINKGDAILKLKEYDYIEQYERAKALVKQYEAEYQASESLNEKGYRSQAQAEAAFAAVQNAKADLKRAQINLENTTVLTPLSGYIDKIMTAKGNFVTAGKPIATIISFDEIIIVVHVPERDVEKIKLGNTAKIDLANDYKTEGKVSFVSKVISSVTRTCRIEVTIPKNNHEMFITKGMIADVQLVVGTVIAHKVPASALILNDEGIVGIKVVENDNTVSFLPVEIIDAGQDGILIFGIPKDIKLITSGHYFVNVGDKVHVG
ncbi:efflux RND transporter periplasmic adaptor subunit [Candidatus Mesenet endosymbiont of Agriotes lineatus]|uniref:efflux RND transporter periplasmic adaptor subunit n=1 Tax=Candidatus Mesenet endosymbiont of Agriotes lineatus TaxID=3077948 RepID=UPI0030CF0697